MTLFLMFSTLFSNFNKLELFFLQKIINSLSLIFTSLGKISIKRLGEGLRVDSSNLDKFCDSKNKLS